ncbi:hypothetical protein RE6C_00664 [Rhodopirellula europaea 6C]|uniref:Uncharacterized protein n=1 Tax=Rhodopirellula europaea 6C TaxID=1263867 RepID=M2AN99_9BACT|nr:hypothetical protein RE6C_00664 [Rhodopirellula europaea 6C]
MERLVLIPLRPVRDRDKLDLVVKIRHSLSSAFRETEMTAKICRELFSSKCSCGFGLT